jgi:hypothetical protein
MLPPPRPSQRSAQVAASAAPAAAQVLNFATPAPSPFSAAAPPVLPGSSVAFFGGESWCASMHARVDGAAAEAVRLHKILQRGADFTLVDPGAAAAASGVPVTVRVLADAAALELRPSAGDAHVVPFSALSGVELNALRPSVRLLPAHAGAATAELVALDAHTAADWVAGVSLFVALYNKT